MFNARQIKEIINNNNLCINKSLGQNFLTDERIRDKMIECCGVKNDDIILEIGPGLGAFTEAIVPLCRRLTAVEKDRGFSVFLRRYLNDKENLEIFNTDILKFDIAALYKRYKKKIKVIGNLPFYITSPIIFHLLGSKKYIDSIFITVQKEVAGRITSAPGSKDYGILSCSVQYYVSPYMRMNIPKSVFFPMPEVDACFLELKIRKEPAVKVSDEELLFKIIKSAFNQRRKTLFNALSGSSLVNIDKGLLKKAFEELSLDYKVRGEKLSLQEFASLTKAVVHNESIL